MLTIRPSPLIVEIQNKGKDCDLANYPKTNLMVKELCFSHHSA